MVCGYQTSTTIYVYSRSYPTTSASYVRTHLNKEYDDADPEKKLGLWTFCCRCSNSLLPSPRPYCLSLDSRRYATTPGTLLSSERGHPVPGCGREARTERRYQEVPFTIWGRFCVPLRKFSPIYKGVTASVGVRYLYPCIPLYIGEILHRGMQNLSLL